MIRNTMFGLSLLALTAGSAFAAPAASHHVTKARTVAQAPAADTTAPTDKPAKKEKKAKKEKADKAAAKDGAKTEGAKDMKAPETK